jgi:hypothetical protein
MKKEYRGTFWSMETGNEWIQSFFLQGGGDEVKKTVLKYRKAKWKAIEPQVKEWVGAGWMGWEREKPEWFSDNWKAKVPPDWVPQEGKEEWIKAVEVVRKTEIRPRFSRVSSLLKVGGEEGGRAGGKETAGHLGVMTEEDEEEDGEGVGAKAEVRGGSRVQPVIR